jgi:hypothetical protein
VKNRVHALSGILAIILVTSFMATTVITEIVGEKGIILTAKTAILFALVVLIPSIIIASGTGRSLAAGRTSPLLNTKKLRAALIAVVGIVVLVPCAVTLRILAAADDFGTTFVVVQAIELAGGIVNLTLLVFNARAGRLLTAARRRRRRNARAGTATPA